MQASPPLQNCHLQPAREARMSQNSPTPRIIDKTGFRLRWRAKLAPYPKPIRYAGFTLIELSIVLVIIGLIVGGVLVGQSLIEAAKVRAEFAKIEKLDAAILTFKLKYNNLPGDIPNADLFGLSVGSNGDRNKRIEGVMSESGGWTGTNLWTHTAQSGGATSPFLPEWAVAQQQLWAAGLLEHGFAWASIFDLRANADGGEELVVSQLPPGKGTEIMASGWQARKPSIVFGYEHNNRVNGHYYRPGTSGSGALFITSFLQTPQTAKAIDGKFDDGNALSGRVMAAPWYGSGCPEGVLGTTATCDTAGGNIGSGANANRCLASGTQDYDTSYDANTCAIRVKAAF